MPARNSEDRTGSTLRKVGGVGLVALVATVMWLPEDPPAVDVPPPGEAPPPPRLEALPEPPPLQPRAERVGRLIPEFPGASQVPMGRLVANGTAMEMAAFEAKASAREVLEFYSRQFQQRGRHVEIQPDGNGGGAVSYYDEGLGALVTVNVVESGTETQPRALAFPAVVEAPQGVHLQGDAPEQLPRPDGVVTVLRVDDRNPGPAQGSATLTQVARGTPKQLADYYRREMGARGYAVRGGSASTQGVETVEFDKSGERVSLTISPMEKEGEPESVILVVMEDMRPGRQEARP